MKLMKKVGSLSLGIAVKSNSGLTVLIWSNEKEPVTKKGTVYKCENC